MRPNKHKKPHHAGSYHVRALALRQAAWADPSTRCWRCKRTITTCGPRGDGRHRNGRRARWTAGHVIDGQIDGLLLPECSPCASTSGAVYGNQLKKARHRGQKAHRALQEPTSEAW